MWCYAEVGPDEEVGLELIRSELDHISLFAYAEIHNIAQPY